MKYTTALSKKDKTMKLGATLNINPDNIRIREFTMAGQKLRVRVPLASEMEAISKAVDDAEWQAKFESLKESFSSDPDAVIEQTEDDVLINGKSIKELAIMSAKTEERIVRMVRLLVPAEEGFDMAQISYADVDSEFPFAVQIELMKKIAEVISPGYEETRKN